mmetsp:Transcript_8963/g.19362  ORF Transcript_8963/g.19362 Transcript_8963/m.19362 type:complete len:253 (-) Transcript_8963:29-787(-)
MVGLRRCPSYQPHPATSAVSAHRCGRSGGPDPSAPCSRRRQTRSEARSRAHAQNSSQSVPPCPSPSPRVALRPCPSSHHATIRLAPPPNLASPRPPSQRSSLRVSVRAPTLLLPLPTHSGTARSTPQCPALAFALSPPAPQTQQLRQCVQSPRDGRRGPMAVELEMSVRQSSTQNLSVRTHSTRAQRLPPPTQPPMSCRVSPLTPMQTTSRSVSSRHRLVGWSDTVSPVSTFARDFGDRTPCAPSPCHVGPK